ncbi:MAG: hypothetical protein J3K34DRAFT_494809 [Monoraphidium minutum]|nr:MAG: hypothetical protein J3K34DRAFT_494809 [Monoraphidium minutum]
MRDRKKQLDFWGTLGVLGRRRPLIHLMPRSPAPTAARRRARPRGRAACLGPLVRQRSLPGQCSLASVLDSAWMFGAGGAAAGDRAHGEGPSVGEQTLAGASPWRPVVAGAAGAGAGGAGGGSHGISSASASATAAAPPRAAGAPRRAAPPPPPPAFQLAPDGSLPLAALISGLAGRPCRLAFDLGMPPAAALQWHAAAARSGGRLAFDEAAGAVDIHGAAPLPRVVFHGRAADGGALLDLIISGRLARTRVTLAGGAGGAAPRGGAGGAGSMGRASSTASSELSSGSMSWAAPRPAVPPAAPPAAGDAHSQAASAAGGHGPAEPLPPRPTPAAAPPPPPSFQLGPDGSLPLSGLISGLAGRACRLSLGGPAAPAAAALQWRAAAARAGGLCSCGGVFGGGGVFSGGGGGGGGGSGGSGGGALKAAAAAAVAAGSGKAPGAGVLWALLSPGSSGGGAKPEAPARPTLPWWPGAEASRAAPAWSAQPRGSSGAGAGVGGASGADAAPFKAAWFA